jgi:hypothetical protein
MFQPGLRELQLASEALGWRGTCVGPVRQLGTWVWPVVATPEGCTVEFAENRDGIEASGDRGPEVDLVGCLVVGEAARELLEAASLFAGYASRAIVVPDGASLDVMVDAAVLDQGVVALGANGVTVLSEAGPRTRLGDVPPLVESARGRVRPSEGSSAGVVQLKEKARRALLAATAAPAANEFGSDEAGA